jgi:Rieske Fe-S protein
MGRINTIYRISRRIITKSIILLLGSILLYKILKVNVFRQKKQITVKLKDVPAGGGIVLREQRAAIVKLNNAIEVYSLVCPHLGCTINLTEELFKCPCHGSEFDLNGIVIKGPANKNLKILTYKIEGDVIIIYI